MDKIEKIYEEIIKVNISENDEEAFELFLHGDETISPEILYWLRMFALSMTHLDEILIDLYAFPDMIPSEYLWCPGKEIITISMDNKTQIVSRGDGFSYRKYREAIDSFLHGDGIKFREIIEFMRKYYSSYISSEEQYWVAHQLKSIIKKIDIIPSLEENIKNKKLLLESMKLFGSHRVTLPDNLINIYPILADLPDKKGIRAKKANNKIKKEIIKRIDCSINYDTNKLGGHKSKEEVYQEFINELGAVTSSAKHSPRFLKLIDTLKTIINYPTDDLNLIYYSLEFYSGVSLSGYDFRKDYNLFVGDIAKFMRMFQDVFSPELLNISSLEELLEKIRLLLFGRGNIEYRNHSLGRSSFILGSQLNREKITKYMRAFDKDFQKAQECEDLVEYVRKCADIFHRILMIHPYKDGNGRTARILMLVMLAKKGIFLPSIIDSYYNRCPDADFGIAGDTSSYDNPKPIEDYFVERVMRFNPELVKNVELDGETLEEELVQSEEPGFSR